MTALREDGAMGCTQLSAQGWAGALLWRQSLPIFRANGEITKGRSKLCAAGVVLRIQAFQWCRIIRGKGKNAKCLCATFSCVCVCMCAEMHGKWFLSTDWINYLENSDWFCTLYCCVWLYSRVHQRAQTWGWLLKPCSCEAGDVAVSLCWGADLVGDKVTQSSVLVIRLMGWLRQLMKIGKYSHRCPEKEMGTGGEVAGRRMSGEMGLGVKLLLVHCLEYLHWGSKGKEKGIELQFVH